MEQSLQSIDPRVGGHYWDFSLDAELHGAHWTNESEIFFPDWFGSASPDNIDAVITEGRWAYTKYPLVSDVEASAEHNSYGILTTKINNNPNRFLARSQYQCGLKNKVRLPGCSVLESLFDDDGHLIEQAISVGASKMHG